MEVCCHECTHAELKTVNEIIQLSSIPKKLKNKLVFIEKADGSKVTFGLSNVARLLRPNLNLHGLGDFPDN